jgi:hypothetical protein
MIQGDPLQTTGIAAITPLVASRLGVQRGLVCLDESIAEYHARDADRHNVCLELRYSQLAERLDDHQAGTIERMETVIDREIAAKNKARAGKGQPPLQDYFRDCALLQEVTKAACAQLCKEMTLVHTSTEIHEFSVTSFYTVGLELGLVSRADMVSFADGPTP